MQTYVKSVRLGPKGRMDELRKKIEDNDKRISKLEKRVSVLQAKLKSKRPNISEVARKRAALKQAKKVGDTDEKYYLATKAWLDNYENGREAAYDAYEQIWEK